MNIRTFKTLECRFLLRSTAQQSGQWVCGSASHGSWVKWVDKCEWVTGQYRKTLDP